MFMADFAMKEIYKLITHLTLLFQHPSDWYAAFRDIVTNAIKNGIIR